MKTVYDLDYKKVRFDDQEYYVDAFVKDFEVADDEPMHGWRASTLEALESAYERVTRDRKALRQKIAELRAIEDAASLGLMHLTLDMRYIKSTQT